jgi:hypothetical protein
MMDVDFGEDTRSKYDSKPVVKTGEEPNIVVPTAPCCITGITTEGGDGGGETYTCKREDGTRRVVWWGTKAVAKPIDTARIRKMM